MVDNYAEVFGNIIVFRNLFYMAGMTAKFRFLVTSFFRKTPGIYNRSLIPALKFI